MTIKSKTSDIRITIPDDEDIEAVLSHPQDYERIFIRSGQDNEVKEAIFRDWRKKPITGPYVPPVSGKDLRGDGGEEAMDAKHRKKKLHKEKVRNKKDKKKEKDEHQ